MLGILIGYVDNAGSFLSISRTFVFFPYFLLGFLLNADQLKQLVRSKYSLPVGIFLFLATMLFFGIGFPKDAVPWLLGDTSYANMGGMQWWDGLVRGLQYSLTLLVVFGFFALIPSTQYKITKIGERTVYVYLFHGFIIKALETMLPDDSLEFLSGNYILLFFLSLFICQILGSYFIKKYTRPLVELKVKTG
jgi:fucose 4-O-acetylase-like acetyltransferase